MEKIPQHRHCVECKKAFIGDGLYCGPECEKGRTDEIRTKKKKLVMIWLFAVALMVVAIVSIAI